MNLDDVARLRAEVPPVVVVGAPPVPAAPPTPVAGVGQVLVESPGLYGEILVNGTSYGFTPVRATVPVGPATIELKVGNAVRKTTSIVVQEGKAHVVLD